MLTILTACFAMMAIATAIRTFLITEEVKNDVN